MRRRWILEFLESMVNLAPQLLGFDNKINKLLNSPSTSTTRTSEGGQAERKWKRKR